MGLMGALCPAVLFSLVFERFRHRRRRLDRQREPEARAFDMPVRRDAIGRADLAVMRVDDRTADREAKTDAGLRRFLLAAREFLEDPRLHAGRQAWPGIVDGDAHERLAVVVDPLCADHE